MNSRVSDLLHFPTTWWLCGCHDDDDDDGDDDDDDDNDDDDDDGGDDDDYDVVAMAVRELAMTIVSNSEVP